jgi:hypothetical protein
VLYVSGTLWHLLCPKQAFWVPYYLRFIIFINDLSEIIPNGTNTALCAHNTKLHRSILSLSDCVDLHKGLKNINVRSQQSNMKFNAASFNFLQLHANKTNGRIAELLSIIVV